MYPIDPTRFRNRFRIPSARRRGYDYGLPGWYFVTICTHGREHHFGDVVNGAVHLSPVGRIVRQCWYQMPEHHRNVRLDAFVVMPNHIHGIIVIDEPGRVETLQCNVSTKMPGQPVGQTNSFMSSISPKPNSLPSIIRTYKNVAAKIARRQFPDQPFAWQPRYHDRVIRNPDELERVRWYIRNNPRMWKRDRNN